MSEVAKNKKTTEGSEKIKKASQNVNKKNNDTKSKNVNEKEQIKSDVNNNVNKKKNTSNENKEIQKNEEKKNTKKQIDNEKQLKNEKKQKTDKIENINLKEIKDAIINKVNSYQKIDLVKEILLNIGIAIIIIFYLMIVMMGTKNISVDVLQVDLKTFAVSFLFIGIVTLERAYKKDSMKIALNAVEVIIFAIINLCFAYCIQIKFDSITYFINNVGLVYFGYYVLKSIIIAIKSVKKYKKDNSDIKEIVKK